MGGDALSVTCTLEWVTRDKHEKLPNARPHSRLNRQDGAKELRIKTRLNYTFPYNFGYFSTPHSWLLTPIGYYSALLHLEKLVPWDVDLMKSNKRKQSSLLGSWCMFFTFWFWMDWKLILGNKKESNPPTSIPRNKPIQLRCVFGPCTSISVTSHVRSGNKFSKMAY